MKKFAFYLLIFLNLFINRSYSQYTVSGQIYEFQGTYSSVHDLCYMSFPTTAYTDSIRLVDQFWVNTYAADIDNFGNFTFTNIPNGIYYVYIDNVYPTDGFYYCDMFNAATPTIDVYNDIYNAKVIVSFACNNPSLSLPYVNFVETTPNYAKLLLLDKQYYQDCPNPGCYLTFDDFYTKIIFPPVVADVNLGGNLLNYANNYTKYQSNGKWIIEYHFDTDNIHPFNNDSLYAELILHPNVVDSSYPVEIIYPTPYTLKCSTPAFTDTVFQNTSFNPLSNICAKGIVYNESLPSNCSYDFGETKLGGIKLLVKDSNNQTVAVGYSTTNDYLVNFPPQMGQFYTLEVDTLRNYVVCPSNNSYSIFAYGFNYNDFGMNIDCNTVQHYDYGTYGAGVQGMIFPGLDHFLYPIVENSSVCPQGNLSGNVKVKILGPINYVGPITGALTPTVTNITGGYELNYTISNFSTIHLFSFGVQLSTNTNAQMNDTIHYEITITTSPNDANAWNNYYKGFYLVSNSYDPNIKRVNKSRVQPGYMDWLYYTIYFQNTGNAPAQNISIYDTLSPLYLPNTFEFLGSSHEAHVNVIDNVIRVTFKDINLPDSASNPQGSIGYFSFRIKPFPGIPSGMELKNKASIYFDYNPPIVTPEAITRFDMTTSLENTLNTHVNIFPNPNSGNFQVQLVNANNQPYEFTILNTLGQVVHQQTLTKENTFIETHLPQGIYIYQLKSLSEIIHTGKLVVK